MTALMRAQMIVRAAAAVSIASVSYIAAAAAWAAPEAAVRPGPHYMQEDCISPAEIKTIAVVDAGKDLATAEYCSAGTNMSAKLFSDRHGDRYVVALTGEQYYEGAPATTYVRVLKLVKREGYSLIDVAGVAVPAPGGKSPGQPAYAQPTYKIIDTEAGGVELVVDYPPTKTDPDWPAPQRHVSVRIGP